MNGFGGWLGDCAFQNSPGGLNGTVLDLSFEPPACFLLELDREVDRC